MWRLSLAMTALTAYLVGGGYVGFLLIGIGDLLMGLYLIVFVSGPWWVIAYLERDHFK